jgi:flagellar biosynthesis/type III secretory pathway M-ring protein FliF/YscJ
MHYKALLVASKEFGLNVNANPHMVTSRDKNAQLNENIKIDNQSFERVGLLFYIYLYIYILCVCVWREWVLNVTLRATGVAKAP